MAGLLLAAHDHTIGAPLLFIIFFYLWPVLSLRQSHTSPGPPWFRELTCHSVVNMSPRPICTTKQGRKGGLDDYYYHHHYYYY
jgi:hypothetical protein